RKAGGAGFSANTEGWALYAEQLCDEMGLYDSEPLGRLGLLQSLLFRAARCVVDTGLHAKGWSRERAIDYMVATTGENATAMTTEVERYCTWPGQACSYKVGHTRWLALRAEARGRPGGRGPFAPRAAGAVRGWAPSAGAGRGRTTARARRPVRARQAGRPRASGTAPGRVRRAAARWCIPAGGHCAPRRLRASARR